MDKVKALKIPQEKIEKVLVSRPVFLERVADFRTILIILVASFATLTIFVKSFPYFQFDLTITRSIQNFRPAWFDFMMVLVSRLGDANIGSLIIVAFIVLALLTRKIKTAGMIGFTCFSMTVINQTFKFLVSRPRPSMSGLVQVVGIFKRSDSFPSGHVMFYVGLYGFLIYIVYTQFRKTNQLRQFLIILFSLMIFLVGISRIYLGAHWFSDVLGAYLLGFSWLIVCIWIYNKLDPNVKPK